MKKIVRVSAIVAFIILLFSCEKNDEPEIVGCNSVKYQGYTYTILGCEPGIASFDCTATQNGHTASFSITCSGGCISSVTVQ
jgi:hypothetical protein